VLQCFLVCYCALQCESVIFLVAGDATAPACCSVWYRVVVCGSVLQSTAERCSVLHCVAVCFSVFGVGFSLLQRVAVCASYIFGRG